MKARVKQLLPYFLAAIIPMTVFVVAILMMPLFGFDRSILFQDPGQQYIDFLNYYKSIFSGENSLLYTFNSGMGAGTIPFFAYYLLSPFNLVVLLFPNALVGVAYIVIVTLKIGAIGLASYWAFKKLSQKSGYFPLLFSLAYTLSAYTLNYFIHFEWLDAVILLPIICVGIDRILSGKKSILYIVSLGLTLITNYYTGFMVCIFAVIWFIFRLVNRPDFSKKLTLISLRRFVIASLIAGGISAVVLAPTVFGMMGGQGRFSAEAFLLDDRFPLITLIEQLTSNSSFNYPLLFVGMPVILLLILFFANPKISHKEKISSGLILAFFVLSVSINFFCALWHAGSLERGAPARFTFVCAFFICYLAMRSLQECKHLRAKTVMAVCFGFAILYLLVLQRELSEIETGLMLIDLVLIALTVWILNSYISKKLQGKHLVGLLLGLNLLCLSIFAIYSLPALAELEHGLTPIRTVYNNIRTIAPVMDESKKQNQSFCRTEKTFVRSENDGLQFLYDGISVYASSSNGGADNALKILGVEGQYGLNTVYDNANNGAVSYGDVQPLTTTSLLGICQIVSNKELGQKNYTKIGEANGYVVYKFNNALGVGVISKDSLASYDLEDESLSENSFANLNKISSEITGKELKIFKPVEEYERTLKNLVKNGNRYTKIDSGIDGEIILKIHNPAKNTVYYLERYLETDPQALTSRSTISITDVLKKNKAGDYEHLTHLNNGTLSFGSDEEIEIKIRVFTDELTIEPEELYYEDAKEFEKFYAVVSSQPVEITKTSNTSLQVRTSTDEDEYLLLTIPYDKGWKIIVDSTEVQPQKALGAFMSIPISAGEHTITMEYKPRGLVAGGAISALSLLAFVWLCITERKDKNETAKN